MRAVIRLAILFGLAGLMFGQTLVVDRTASGTPAGLHFTTQDQTFLGDDFTLGAEGETWTIDTMRVWAVSKLNPSDVFEQVTLYGAIASDPPASGQAECSCHGPVAIKTMAPEGVEIAPGLWQVEFRDLRWSVPGGLAIEFGVKAIARATGETVWRNAAAPISAAHHLRVFDAKGLLQSFFDPGEERKAEGIRVQVWAHRTVEAKAHTK